MQTTPPLAAAVRTRRRLPNADDARNILGWDSGGLPHYASKQITRQDQAELFGKPAEMRYVRYVELIR